MVWTMSKGPLGITDYDKEGMLLEDYDSMAAMTEYYNYPYYPEHMEALGFKKAVDWVQIRVKVPDEVPARYARVAKLSKEMFGLRLRTLTKKEILGGYGLEIFKLLNAAYAPLFGFTPMSEQQAMDYIRMYLPLLNLNMVPVVENNKGEAGGHHRYHDKYLSCPAPQPRSSAAIGVVLSPPFS